MDDLYRQAIDLEGEIRDNLDDPNHPTAVRLRTDIRRLVDLIEAKRNPRTLESEVYRIIQQLESAEGSNIISETHLDELRDRFEDMRQAIRRLQ